MHQHKHRHHNGEGSNQSASLKWIRRLAHREDVLLVTDKKRTPMQNLRHRKRTYNVLQALRIPLLILAGISYMYWHNWLLSTVLFVVSVPLPWIAVVIANGHGEPRDPREKQIYKPGAARELNRQAQLAAQETAMLTAADADSKNGKEVELFQDFHGITIDADTDLETPHGQ